MFNSYEFTFNGESSMDYGLMLYDIDRNGQDTVGFGNKASIVETRTKNRITPLHFGVSYNERPLQFKLVFGSDRELDRYTLEEISMWLTGHQDYKWLTIEQPDLDMVQFRCLITELSPIMHGWLPVAFEATVTCDCPYAYGMPFEFSYQINGSLDVVINNDGSVREHVKPKLLFVPSIGTEELRIVNHSDGDREMRIKGIPASSSQILIDNENGVITELVSGVNMYDGFNMKFFRLTQGDNLLTIYGSGTLTISGRFLHNVGA